MKIWRFLSTRKFGRVFVIFLILTTVVLAIAAIVLPTYL
jgi:hypothetical protein